MSFAGGSFGEAFYRGQGRPSGSEDLYLGVGVHNDPNDPSQYINIRLTDGASFYQAGSLNFSGSISISGSNAQGAPGPLSGAWPVILVSGSDAVGTITHPFWVTGSVSVLNGPTQLTVISGSVVGLLVGGAALSNANPAPVTGSIDLVRPSTSSVTRVVVLDTSTTVMAANPGRVGAKIYNEGDAQSIFLKMGLGASTASYSLRIVAGGFYELQRPVFTGPITAVVGTDNAVVLVTELTP